jgi:hypothetical protein
MASTRVACNKEGEGNGGKSDGGEGGGRATATRATATEGENNQPAAGSTKVGGGWQESAEEVTTRPQRWATMNDESVWRMTMAAMNRARVDRAMVMEIRVVGDKEGTGDDKKDDVGDEGGVRQRRRWRWLQEQ